ncbi:hypothetical protein [Azospirillum argentinense]
MLYRKRLVAAALGAALAIGLPSYGLATDLPDPSEFKKAVTLDGCRIIPFADLRARCVEADNGLQAQDACAAPACQASAGVDENRRRQRAWSNCAARRAATLRAFTETFARFELLKMQLRQDTEPNRTYKTAMTILAGRVLDGQPGRGRALQEAETALAACAAQI